MNHKKSYGINIGTSSILVIIVILCLVCFAGLSIVSANADYKLSQKLADRTTAYYQASMLANERLVLLNDSLYEIYMDSADENSYFETIKESFSDSLTFSYPVSDVQALSVTVEPLYPADSKNRFFNITAYQVITTKEPETDDSLPVLFHN